jgi:hypothetical protein
VQEPTATPAQLGREPLPGEVVLFEDEAIRKFWFWSHGDCRVIITNKRLVFWDREKDKFSFEIPADQLRDARFDKAFQTDLVIRLRDGSKYEIGLPRREQWQTLVTQIIAGHTEKAAEQPPAKEVLEAPADAGKIRYLLILIEEMPVQGSAWLKDVVLSRLCPEGTSGTPYRGYVDSDTQIETLQVGDEDFSDWRYVSIAAYTNFVTLWGHQPDLRRLRWQPFAGQIGRGVVIQEHR